VTRVLFVIPGLGPGGAERSLAEEIPGLLSRGIDAQVACFRVRPQGVHESVASVVPLHVLPAGRVARMRSLGDLVRRLRPHLIHTSVLPADLAGRLVGAATRTPVVSTLVNTAHDLARLADPQVGRTAFEGYRLADATTAQLCVGFRALTPAVKASSAQALHLSPDRIVVIPRGRDLESLKFSERKRQDARGSLGMSPESFVVGNVARQEYQKGLDTLVRAFHLLRRTNPHAVLVQAGRTGSHSEAIAIAARESCLADEVFLELGYRQDVSDVVLPACDVFAFPSRYEGFGGAVLEAAAAGLPIVASDLPALRDVLGDAATFVAPDDVDAWAEALAVVARRDLHPPIPDVVARAQRFDIESVTTQVATWLHGCAEARTRVAFS
jgi:glycosyltransferase involved in cell wall biosynthesis